ncbi:MAG: filamentous hemagglutinin N-terminal domain-containing protein, partial [Proteobacteria bacterium]|nr:filamentous hemagglutinin N-terminal domain-containing protein [Pseudomonadota bacterium]
MFKKIFVISVLLSLNSYAEVTSDSSNVETVVNFNNNNFEISKGLQEGRNLFHSFDKFSIDSGQTATFTTKGVSGSVNNILSRVTGNNSSKIYGGIISEIPNANLYLMNPNGIIFGEGASLDLQGSFHATTANYLQLGNNDFFYAKLDENSTFTTANLIAFGFLDNPQSITINGSELTVPDEKTLSIIGGDLEIKNSLLYVHSGRINLVSIASEGTVEQDSLNINASQKGKIIISRFLEYEKKPVNNNDEFLILGIDEYGDPYPAEYNDIDVSNYTNIADAGQIFIRGGKLLIEKAGLLADTYDYDGEPKENTGIDIEITGDIELIDNAVITADNRQIDVEEKSGDIKITAENLIFSQTEEYFEDSRDFINEYLGLISTDSFGPGTAGNINIKLGGLLDLNPGGILSIAQSDYIEGNGGNIDIKAREIIIQNNGMISADTFGENAGDINIIATDSIYLVDTYIYEEIIDKTGGISSCACEEDSFGLGGNIKLKTPNLILDYAEIGVYSYSEGDAGSIDIEADMVSLNKSGFYAESINAGGGNI